jgi:two-component system copper resistance phosphate regulon response regulator CusR
MRILVVEDDRKVAGFIEMGLREEGYAVDLARDGEEAIVLAHVNDYDAILLDLMLPKKNGLQVAAELPGRTITSPSRSSSTSCWPGCGPWYGAAARHASSA